MIFSVNLPLVFIHKFLPELNSNQQPGKPREQHLGEVRQGTKYFRIEVYRDRNIEQHFIVFLYFYSLSTSYSYTQNWRNTSGSILDLVQTEVIYSNSCLHLKMFVQHMTVYNSTAYFNNKTVYNSTAYFNNNYRKSVTFALIDSNPQYFSLV